MAVPFQFFCIQPGEKKERLLTLAILLCQVEPYRLPYNFVVISYQGNIC